MLNKKSIIDLLDHLGTKPKFYFNRNRRYSSIIGAIVSMVLFCAIMVIIIYFFVEYLSGSELNVIYSKEAVSEPISLNLNKKIFMMSLTSNLMKPIDPRIAYLTGMFISYEFEKVIATPIPIENCSLDRHFSERSKELIKSYDVSFFKCISPEFNMSLLFDEINLNGGYFYIYITKCKGVTQDNRACFPEEEINQALSNSSYTMSFITENDKISHFNETHPIIPRPLMTNMQISTSIFYDYFFYWKKIEYKSDKGFFYSEWKHYVGWMFDNSNTRSIINTSTDKHYVPNSITSFQMNLDPDNIENYQRIYPKIQTYIASVGGLITVTFRLAELIVMMITTGLYYVDLSDSLVIDVKRPLVNNPLNVLLKSKLCSNNSNAKTETSNMNRQKKIGTCVAIQWMILPKMNATTKLLFQHKKNISNYLSLENILSKLVFLEKMFPKDNIKIMQSFQNCNVNQSKSFAQINNYLDPMKGYFAEKPDSSSLFKTHSLQVDGIN